MQSMRRQSLECTQLLLGSRRTQSAPVSVVDVAQQARELELALSIPNGLEVAQLLKGLNIPVSDLRIHMSSFRHGTFRSGHSSEGLTYLHSPICEESKEVSLDCSFKS